MVLSERGREVYEQQKRRRRSGSEGSGGPDQTDPYVDVPPPDEAPTVVDIGRARKPKRDEPELGDDAPKRWKATDLEPAAQPRWLAANRLPRAAVSLLIGDEGIGKSLLWVLVATHITTGKPFPGFGIPARGPGRVILVATEDDWSTAVLPRLEVAGADLDQIDVICVEKDGSGTPIFPRDMPLIRADPKPDLVVVDCWLDTVPGGINGFNVRDAQQARQALHPWREVAMNTDAAIWLLAHSNRVATGTLRDRYGATYVLRQKARMTIYAMADGDGLLAGPEKANGAVTTVASRFTITPIVKFARTDEHDGTVPLLKYEGFSECSIREHVVDKAAAAAQIDKPADPSDPVGWLVAQLRAGPRWSVDIATAAECDRISPYKLRAAKQKLNVKPGRDGGTGFWYLRLPQHAGQVPGANLSNPTLISHNRQLRQLGKDQKPLSTSKESSCRSPGYMESSFSPEKCGCGKELTNPVSIRLRACGECRLVASNDAQPSLFVES
jgi:hypothetical protein